MATKYKLYDAFPTKAGAVGAAKSLRDMGDRATVRKGNYGDAGRLNWGVYEGGKKKRR